LHPKDIIDTTGAGDAFTSGFLAAYIHNEPIENAMRQGAEYASEILGRIGAQ
jgi:fructokinase